MNSPKEESLPREEAINILLSLVKEVKHKAMMMSAIKALASAPPPTTNALSRLETEVKALRDDEFNSETIDAVLGLIKARKEGGKKASLASEEVSALERLRMKV